MIQRRNFILGALAAAGCPAAAFAAPRDGRWDRYSVAVLGDTHFDTEPDTVYHAHYDDTNRWAKVQRAEFKRNGEMWRERCPRLLASSAALARKGDTRFILQLGDLIQGDCDDFDVHVKMLVDCMKYMQKPYPAGMPFLTVKGNHDYRGKGGFGAYDSFVKKFVARQVAKVAGRKPASPVKYPAFSFRTGPDLWVFADFETRNVDAISDLIDADKTARYVFLVTHGPFTPHPFKRNYAWRLAGRTEKARVRLYETLSRRKAIVLSGHTHSVTYYRHRNKFGSFTELTVNSVWTGNTPVTGEASEGKLADYGYRARKMEGEAREKYEKELALFKSGITEFFNNWSAGHFRLNVSDSAVTVDFYPGDAQKSARTFKMA